MDNTIHNLTIHNTNHYGQCNTIHDKLTIHNTNHYEQAKHRSNCQVLPILYLSSQNAENIK